MIHENEIIMLALGVGVYIFVVSYRAHLTRIPAWPSFLFAYRMMLGAWVFTVLEGFFWEQAFNLLEHFCYTCSTAAMALGCYRSVWARRGRET